MRILLTNDDGIEAAGLRALAEELTALGPVTVVAPARPRSAVSQSITLHRPIVVHPRGRAEFAVEGTPTDCVKLAMSALCPRRPQMVVSGINHGLNTGANILYSGTVAGAFEAALQGVPAVAVSLQAAPRMDFGTAARAAVPIIRALFGEPGVVYNVNLPSRARIRGVRITRQAFRIERDRFRRRSNPRGIAYYWLESVDGRRMRGSDLWTDEGAVRAGYASVTPLTRDLTAHGGLQELGRRLRVPSRRGGR